MPEFGTRDEFDAKVIGNAESFYSSVFRGRGVFDIVASPTLDEAREAARRMYEDRPVMIYAASGGRQVHIENWEPNPKVAWRPTSRR